MHTSSSGPCVYRPHDEAPASATLRSVPSAGAWQNCEAYSLELISRGDFVQGSLHLSPTRGTKAVPLVVLAHATGSRADATDLDFSADWVSSGLGVARIDLPLHGRRASPKLSARLIQGYERLTRGSALDAETSALVEEFARQSTSDLIRTIEALGRRPEIDAERIALAGLGIGAMTSLWAARHSPTLRACVLAGGAGQLSGSPLDPAAMFEDGSASMPDRWLFFSRREDPETSEAAAKALFEALPGSKQQLEMTSAPSQGGITSEAALSARDFLVQTLARR